MSLAPSPVRAYTSAMNLEERLVLALAASSVGALLTQAELRELARQVVEGLEDEREVARRPVARRAQPAA